MIVPEIVTFFIKVSVYSFSVPSGAITVIPLIVVVEVATFQVLSFVLETVLSNLTVAFSSSGIITILDSFTFFTMCSNVVKSTSSPLTSICLIPVLLLTLLKVML